MVGCRFAAFIPFDNDSQPFGRLLVRFSYLIVFCHKMQDSVKSFLKEVFPHTLGAAAEEKLYLNAVSFLEPVAGGLCLELQIVVASADFDLNVLGF